MDELTIERYVDTMPAEYADLVAAAFGQTPRQFVQEAADMCDGSVEDFREALHAGLDVALFVLSLGSDGFGDGDDSALTIG